ncbi:MAG: HAD family hydrolase [Anaerolineales bacterium]|nr:HAD family hydrolase [Anaerolineales bacterium]
MLKAIIFDFDGLILDTETPEYIAWQEIFAEHGCELSLEMWGQVVGGAGFSDFDAASHLEELLRSTNPVGHPFDCAALNARWRQRGDELIAAQAILPGVRDYLDDAQRLGLRLAIASSSKHSWVDGHLARLGLLAHFERIICADDVTRTKPDPELYRAALAALHIRAEEAIVFEDSPNGVKAAKRAGIFVVAVPNPLTARLWIDGADLTLKSLVDVPLIGLLQRVNRKSFVLHCSHAHRSSRSTGVG